MNRIQEYAYLLVNYCLNLQKGEKLYVTTTVLAQDLVKAVYHEALKKGAHMEYHMAFSEQKNLFYKYASDHQLNHVSPLTEKVMSEFDAFLVIKAPFNLREEAGIDAEKKSIHSAALTEINKTYFERTANGSMKRTLCQFPTQASAQEAGMSLSEYEDFVYNACRLNENDARGAWLEVGRVQQGIVDRLNTCRQIRYKNERTDISFSVEGRTWINSDGKTNMPSGEVFTSPVEDSVNGVVHFDYPSIYNGQEVRNVTLTVKEGVVTDWDADFGREVLDEIFKIPGANRFGEVAIGTNYKIQRATRNILFDEKIGGSIHMAVGQSYFQTGGRNESMIHWDMIADMRDGGEIWADGSLIYKNGRFTI